MRIHVGRIGSTHRNIIQRVIWVDENRKREALFDLLYNSPPTRTIIFVNKKSEADLVDDYLYNLKLPSTSIHADRTQREREDALRAFRSGRCPILVSTGVFARGLDIKDAAHVINYDLPDGTDAIQEYTHRIGRTGRIGHTGLATSFYNEGSDGIAQGLVNVLTENKQPVPDFLQHLQPEEGGQVTFDDESDEEDAGGMGGDDVDPFAADASGGGFNADEDNSNAGVGADDNAGKAADDDEGDW